MTRHTGTRERSAVYILPCCGAPSSGMHVRGCRYDHPIASSAGGPYCIARRCTLRPLHRAGSPGCALTADDCTSAEPHALGDCAAYR